MENSGTSERLCDNAWSKRAVLEVGGAYLSSGENLCLNGG